MTACLVVVGLLAINALCLFWRARKKGVDSRVRRG
jgi:hypothetical protein